MQFLKETTSVWDKLQKTDKPIVIYGMGDGAVKIMNVCAEKKIKISALFASDDYVRGHSFMGYKVHKLSEIEEMFSDFIILLAFAVHDIPTIERIYLLSQKYELYAPDVPVIGGGLFDMDYVSQNAEQIKKAYSLLADDLSKKVFADSINYKISGNIDYLKPITTDKSEIFEKLIIGKDEIFMDLGAYDGDTIRELLEFTGGEYNSIIAVEPDKKNFKKLSSFIEENGLKNVRAENVGIWSESAILKFDNKAGRNSSLSENGKTELMVNSVDNILNSEPATIIKMDVEGAEKEALLGAAETINKYKPKIIASAYHRNEDIFSLINQINDICPDYKIYLRHHLYLPAWETNIYAAANGQNIQKKL